MEATITVFEVVISDQDEEQKPPLSLTTSIEPDQESSKKPSVDPNQENQKRKLRQKPPSTPKLELCTICGKMVSNYRQHIKKHKFTCDHCFVSFKSDKQLSDHVREVHSTGNQYSCDFCNLKFKSVVKLVLHKYTHTKRYVCPLCGFEASNKAPNSIKSHIYRHEDNFKFRCEHCAKGFLSSAKLRDHLDMHSGDPKYECEICHKKFTVKNYLKLHIGFNHKKEVFGIEETFQCEICGRKFTFEKSFRRHLSTIHKIGKDLTVECPVCHKIIANSFNLKKHMRIHTGEKNFACQKCGKRFSDMKYVKKHQSVHLREMGLLKSRKGSSKLIKLDSILPTS